MKSILRLAAVVLLSIKPVHGGKKYCEKKGPTEADCLALKASKKCVWADEACVKDPDAEGGKKGCKGMKGKEKKKCKKKCKGKKGKAKKKCKGKDSK